MSFVVFSDVNAQGIYRSASGNRGAGRSYLFAFAAGVLFLFFFTVPIFPQEDGGGSNGDQGKSGNGPIVRDIQFEGLDRFAPSEMLAQMQTEVGKPFRERILRNDIHRLYKLGSVKRVRWNKERVENGVKITLLVQENPRIQKVILKGVHEFAKRSLRDELDIVTSRTMDENKLNRDRQHIKKKYRERGYHFVSVRTKKLQGEDGIILRIEVVEGPQVYIGNIRVEGTKEIEEDTVIDTMKSAPSWFWGSSYYREDRLMKDLKRIRRFYRKRGYLDAKAELKKVRFNPEKTYAFITIGVQEGQQYEVGQIQFEGNTIFEREKLMEQIVLESGEPFRLDDVSADRRSVKRLYGRNSYVDTQVDWHYQVIEGGNTVRLVFQITERGETTTGKIKIEGNTKTKEKVIRRNIEVVPGEPLNLVKLRESIDQLRATRYFEKVTIDRRKTDEPGVQDLHVNVKETSTGRIRFGGGFSSNVGLIGIFQISQQNFDISNTPESFSEIIEGKAFAGAGQKLTITMRPGTERSRYSISFREPYLYDQPVGLDVEGSIFDQIFEEYDEHRAGGGFGLDYRFGDMTVSNKFEVENIEISDVDSDSPDDFQNAVGDHILYSTRPGFSIDKRNRSINTSSGYEFSTSYKVTGGDFDFGKWRNDFRYFYPLYSHPQTGDHILSLQTRYGWSHSFDSSEKTPVFERFFAGGSRTIRGFDFRSISPREGDVEVGGETQWIANLEYTFPLIRSDRRPGGRRVDYLRGAVFTDAGTVGFENSDLDDNVRSAAGVGIRFKIPGMGQRPFALDFALPIKKLEKDDTRVISFDIGASF